MRPDYPCFRQQILTRGQSIINTVNIPNFHHSDWVVSQGRDRKIGMERMLFSSGRLPTWSESGHQASVLHTPTAVGREARSGFVRSSAPPRRHHGGSKENTAVGRQIKRKSGSLEAMAVGKKMVFCSIHHQGVYCFLRFSQSRGSHGNGRKVPTPG